MARKETRLLVRIVHVCDQNVFEREALLLVSSVVVAGRKQCLNVVTAIDRHDSDCEPPQCAVQRNGQPNLQTVLQPVCESAALDPLVEIVMWCAPIPRPHSALIIRIARSPFSRLASGSPIPMNTMLSIFSPVARSTAMSWSTISFALRLREKPSKPLAQNLHP